MKLLLIAPLLACATAAAQKPAPPIGAAPLQADRPFPGWPGLRGNVVIIGFWATCAALVSL